MKTALKSYVVAEIPDPLRGQLAAIRKEAGSTANLPIEITLAGSSGVGPIPIGTDLELIKKEVDRILEGVHPFETSFKGWRVFPHTSIAYLSPVDREPFDRFHTAFKGSGVPFSAIEFPYTAHCTISRNFSANELSKIDTRPFPSEPFVIDTVSVYDLDDETLDCHLLHQVRLSTKQ